MTTAEGPADIRDMRILHSALRRDLERTRIVLSDPALVTGDRRRAIGAHLVWLMHTLHRHHTGEDEHVWPEIRRREPSAGPLLDEMDTDHRRIAEPIREIEQVAVSLGAAPYRCRRCWTPWPGWRRRSCPTSRGRSKR